MVKKLAGIEYSGMAGITQDCVDAVMRYIQYGDKIKKASILSASGKHGLLLTINSGDIVGIKAGFTTGYAGEGPRKFSYILQLLDAHKVELDEYKVDEAFIKRLNDSALTEADIKWFKSANPVRPRYLYEYIQVQHFEMFREKTLWEDFPVVIPFTIIDPRIIDLAISFWENPDEKLLKGYRRLEDIVRKRTHSEESGAKLFSSAFLGTNAVLRWKKIDPSEQIGRANLFINTYMAHRNPRAHKEQKVYAINSLSEFLLLNHLYILEEEASEVQNKTRNANH